MSLLFIIPPPYIPTLARQQTGLPSAVPPYFLAVKQVAILAAVQPDGLHPFENTNAILSGTYEAVFRGCDVIERPKFDGSPGLETAIKLYFEVPAEEATITKFDNLRFSPRSNLRRDLRQMSGADFRDEVFNNRAVLWEHIQTLIGRAYTIRCEPAESGAFTKITDIATPRRTASKGKKTAVLEDAVPF